MLRNKVVLITGAGRGIGKAAAAFAAKNHAQVIINYNKSHTKASSLESALKKQGLKAVKIKADVSNESEVKQMFEKINNKFGRLDILVNNAGIVQNNLLLMTQTAEFEKIVNTNCKGTFLCTRFAVKMMMKRKTGKIINIASIVGTRGNRGQAVYAASKAFIIGFTKSLAKELGVFNITVNAIAPGVIDTDMTKNLPETVKSDLLNHVSLKRIGMPEDVAKVILFLSSDLSDYLSGQVIGVDGGQII